MHFAALISLVFVSVAFAAPLAPDPSGAKNLGNGKGGQFITGQCLSNADCASACCATLGNLGICSGPGASTQQGKTGCGFGGGGAAAPAASQAPAAPANDGAAAPAAGAAGSGLKPDPAGEKNVGKADGSQFITGQCTSNADCGSACCATLGNIGICSGPGAQFQAGKTGCGFGGGGAAAPAASQAPAAPADNGAAAPAAGAAGSGLKPDPAGEKNVGKADGSQFITGQCTSNADCGSGCCATLGNIGICSGPGAATQAGKTGCGFGSKKRSLGGVFAKDH